MDARFRIRTQQGEELSPASVEAFSELVRSGVVRPHDMVFDALTGEWAPARLHPMVRLFQDPLVVDPTEEALERRLTDGDGDPPSPQQPPGEELVLDLVEAEAVSPEEEARAFMAKMEEERRSDPDLPSLSLEVPLIEPGSGAVEGLVPEATEEERAGEPPGPANPTPHESSTPRAGVVGGRALSPAYKGSGGAPGPSWARAPSTDGWRRGWLNATIMGGAAVALALSVFWPPDGASHDPTEGVARTEGGSTSDRPMPVTEEQTRSRALAAFLDGVEALREELGVGEVPRVWLEGQYLADAGAYPEVRGYWERYLAFVAAVRASEVTLYRGAYLAAAGDAGISGPVRSLRLASAQQGFAQARGRREGVYRRVEGLARAALALDDLLLQMKGRVTYEPIGGPRVSADPVIEAAGTDEDAQLRLEAALDRVLEALRGHAGTSEGDRGGVPGLLPRGLEAVQAEGGTAPLTMR